VYLGLSWLAPALGFGWTLIITALSSTACWIGVAFLTAPTDQSVLLAFYERVRPGTPWWGPIAKLSHVSTHPLGWRDVGEWVAALLALYAAVFGVGWLALGDWVAGAVALVVAALAGSVLIRSVTQAWRET
jgi:solute:Na+ symporter, SSS family